MKKRKLFKSFIALTVGCAIAVSATACGKREKGDEKVINQSDSIVITEFDSEVSLLHGSVRSYLSAQPEELVSSYLFGGTTRCDKGEPIVIETTFISNANTEITEKKLEVSTKEDFSSIVQTYEIGSYLSSAYLYNLQPDETYYYRAVITLKNGEKHIKTKSFTTEKSIRFISLDGACNVRDIGGWKTESGKSIKYGLLYRGSEIDGGKNKGHADFCLTKKGIEQLRSLGIKTDLDLRSEECKVSEYSILGEDVSRTFYNAPQYQGYFNEASKETVRKIFSALAKPSAYPVYLHCTHGVDRAGSASLILGSLLGVSKDDLIRDYELSAFYYSHVNRNVDNGGTILNLIEKLEEFQGETLSEKTANFLLSVGVTQEEIASIRNIFLG